jgi:hypothetical protein
MAAPEESAPANVEAQPEAPAPSSSQATRVVIALLIALTSILGAGTAWRASKASIAAEEAEREAFRQKVENVAAQATVRETPEDALLAYARWLSWNSRAGVLGAADAPSLQLDALATRHAALRAWRSVPPTARGSRPGRLNLKRAEQIQDFAVKNGEVQSGVRLGTAEDLDPLPEIANADRLRKKENRLAGLAAFIVAAAVFFAAAQILRSRIYRVPLIAGGIVLVVALALAVYVDRAT